MKVYTEEINVGWYYETMISEKGSPSDYLEVITFHRPGDTPDELAKSVKFLPSDDDIKIIETLRGEKYSSYLRPLERHLKRARDEREYYLEQLEGVKKVGYRYLEYYIKNEFVPIVYSNKEYGKPIDGHLGVMEGLAEDLALWGIAKEIEDRVQEFDSDANAPQSGADKFTWKRQPSELGYLIAELERCGYIEFPKKRNGSKNTSAAIKLLTGVFDGVNAGTLRQSIIGSGSQGAKLQDKLKKSEIYDIVRKATE